MHLAISGSTGPTGRALVSQASDQGHHLTAVVRDPAAVDATGARLQAVRADVLDRSSFDGVLNGVDAVLSAIGTHGRQPTTVYSVGAANIRDAMHHAGVQRFIGISALPVTRRTELGPAESRRHPGSPSVVGSCVVVHPTDAGSARLRCLRCCTWPSPASGASRRALYPS
jgi:putative NADH-flavin reductase